MVAWSVKALAFHLVNSSPEQGVDRIPLKYGVLRQETRKLCSTPYIRYNLLM